jgi:CRP-like cAMP-binding protein
MIPIERLQQIPLFSTVDVQALARIAPLFHHARHHLGDVISAQGATGDALYVLESGTLRVRFVDARGQERLITYYQPPRVFGETSLLTGVHHDATVDVFSKTAELLVLNKDDFDTLLTEHPEIKEQLTIRSDIQMKLTARPFKWLSDGEYVVVHTRRHRFALVLMMRLPALVAVGLLFLAVLSTAINAVTASAFSFLASANLVLWGLALIWIAGSLGWTILDWSNDFLIVTNKRVIHLEKVALLIDEREEAPIEQVADVQESSIGLAARLFEYSNIRIETAGHQIDINFTFTPRRLRVRQKIFEQIERIRSRSQFESRERVRAEIREELQKYIRPPGIAGQAAPVPAAVPAAPLAHPIRQRRTSAAGKRLNALLGLQIEEQGRITWRKHWLDLLGRTIKWIGIFAVTIGIGLAILIATWQQASNLGRLLYLALWLIVSNIAGFLVWYHYEDWRNDIYQLTDDRVLDIEQSPFRLKERSLETTLDRVQNVSYKKPHLLANLFNYGDLIIETAGGQGQLLFKSVLNPQWATQEIFRRREAHRERRQHEQSLRSRAEFLDWLLEYHRLLQHQGDVQVLPATQPPATPPAEPTATPAEPNPGNAPPAAPPPPAKPNAPYEGIFPVPPPDAGTSETKPTA